MTSKAASAMGNARRSQDLYHSFLSSSSATAANVIQPSAAPRLPTVGGGIRETLLRNSLPKTKTENVPAADTRRYASLSSARRASSSRLFSTVALNWSVDRLALSASFTD